MIVSVVLVMAPVMMPGTAVDETSVEFVCEKYPERIHKLFGALDLEREGLASVKAKVEAKDWPGACRALLEYYKEGDSASWLRRTPPKPGTGRDKAADEILDGVFTFYKLPSRIPNRPDGGLDWTYNGPNGDREWGWGLNRFYWAGTLLNAYHKTGNVEYVERFDALLRDWVLSNPYPGKANRTPQWRGLETYARVNSAWPNTFYGLMDVDALTPGARILILSSIPDHAHYARNFHAGGGNWITMELLGLAKVAVYWPEFRDADAWYDYAMERMIPEMTKQVYPDGVQKELTSHYHRVALRCFDRFVDLADTAGREVPQEFRDGVERMSNYIAYTMRPSGYGILNNDSNLDHTRPEILRDAADFSRPDWRFIATNGAEGTAPEGPPSVVFPWAGHLIMRSGWDADAQWAFFDVGPLGIGHWHRDKLHFSASACGRDILVDAGRYTYKGGAWRNYFTSSKSHNVLMIDGKGQKVYEKEASAPMSGNWAVTDVYDFAVGTFDAGYEGLEGPATHTRAVLYVRGKYWVVVDRVVSDRPRTLTALWHFAPDCTVQLKGAAAETTDESKGNVRILPVGAEWTPEIAKGREKPDIQGWWSREYNIKEPSPCVVYTANQPEQSTFAWVIVPARGTAWDAAPKAVELADAGTDRARVMLTFADGHADKLGVPLSGNAVEFEARK